MKKIYLCISLVLAFGLLQGQTNPLWLRNPAISPDGKTIVFSYQGDLYRISSAGGQAIPLTVHEAYENYPVWSHDGKWIAFASDRYGNFDVFIMPATGGEAWRLTHFSGNDIPSDFSPDNKTILFSSARQDLVSNVQFSNTGMSELYAVPVNGGRATQVISLPALDARFNQSGDKIIYHDYKGYEDNWRKHHTSSVTRDLWSYDLKSKKFEQLTDFKGEDRNPVFHSNNSDFYYLSEQTGSFNIHKSSLANKTSSQAITKFSRHPVRFLTIADDNTLCFTYDGEIYTQKENGTAHKLNVQILVDGRANLEKFVPVSSGITEMDVSPNGKEIAFVVRGEIYVSSVEGGITKRITNTPGQERSVNFSPDGRTLVYAAERGGSWDLYTSSITRKEEPYFYASTVLKEEVLIATDKEEFQPVFSPDGKEVAYLEERVILKVINLASKQTRTILPAEKNYSYSDGDQYFTWSPDSKWLLVSFMALSHGIRDIGLVQADGKGSLINLTRSGFNDRHPRFSQDGSMIYWFSDYEGSRGLNFQSSTWDVYGLFLTKDAYDRFQLSKEDYALLKETEGKNKKDSSRTGTVKPVEIEWKGLEDRKARLTLNSFSPGDALLHSNNEKLYYLAAYEKGLDLWVVDPRTKEVKQLAKLDANNASADAFRDDKSIFILADGKALKIDAESGKKENITINGEMVLNTAGEREYIFDHAWRQVQKKFYLENLQGVDWPFYYKEYRKFLPFVKNNYDFADMLGEMLGELNASHTGCRFNANQPNTDNTASLGVFYDYAYTGNGLRIAEVITKGPLDKVTSKIKAGHIIEAIDGVALNPEMDFYQLLNRKAGKLTLLTVFDPQSKTRWDESMKPVSRGEENELIYQRWVESRRKEVERLSGGRLGYVHVRGMNDASMRVVYNDVLGKNFDKEALVVDTRFNGGGNLHDVLSDFLNGKKYVEVVPRGQKVQEEPTFKWNKPSIVIMGESNYSDAHLFPLAYKWKNVGKLLGMPVPGTGTSVWWETQIDPSLVFGIPQRGFLFPDGTLAENNQTEPDIKVKNDPELLIAGKDQQLEAAVSELLKSLPKK